uniref:CD3 gamma/delta subunit Ig-like domain-containing protein n=1 Tax=Neolamprologus brichardi TaxID=32507 RepID=A0A3Q4FYF4_NEOBR
MKNLFALASCLLLLWTFTGSNRSCCISKQACTVLIFLFSQTPVELQVKEVADGIALSCSDDKINVTSSTVGGVNTKSLHLPYKDDSTGEYKCGENDLIFVKFRTCDSCVEVDTPSLISMVIGNVVATIVVGVGVYLIASQTSQTRTGPVVSNKKSKSGQKDTYDELVHRR